MFNVALQVVVVFVAAVLIDVFYALWFRFSNRGWEHKAALMSTLCGGAGLLGAWFVIAANKLYAIPDLLGLYVGTIVGLRFSKWLEKKWDVGRIRPLGPEEIKKLRKILKEL